MSVFSKSRECSRLVCPLFLLLTLSAIHTNTAAHAATPGSAFPPFPSRYVDRYPDGIRELKELSAQGDGYATLLVAAKLDCKSKDANCNEKRNNLYKLAQNQGESIAGVMLRLADIETNPQNIEQYRVHDAVCGTDIEGVADLVDSITSLDPQGHPSKPRYQFDWEVQEFVDRGGSGVWVLSRGPQTVLMLARDGVLQWVRVTTIVLEIGLSDEIYDPWEDVRTINRHVARTVCPNWKQLDKAVDRYFLASIRVWPPGGVHVVGSEAYLAATAVTPDIAWFDLYIDPTIQPFTSRIPPEWLPTEDPNSEGSD